MQDESLRTSVLAPAAPHWPTSLDHIEGSPQRLHLRGRLELIAHTPRIAIVGSRTPSPYGIEQARRFAAAFARAGTTVVSGLARGIDSAAHTAALDAGGATIAVLGCGVDRPWPDGPLARRMVAEGLLLSEFPPGTPPRKRHFPLRNRLISGLSEAVVVVEAAFRSGSLITARWAADQGRTVFAIPGRVDHPMARGCHRLILEGATLVEEPGDVLNELELTSPEPTDEPDRRNESPLLDALRGETLDAEALAEHAGQDIGQVLAELAQLELDGRVTRAPGGLYLRRE